MTWNQSSRQCARAQAYGLPATPADVSPTTINFWFFCLCLLVFFSHSVYCFSYIVVNCGRPDIPEDGILQLVGSDDPQTQYKDQIQFNCSSKYYTLEGDGDYRRFLLIPFLVSLTCYSFSKFLFATFQTHSFAVPVANGYQLTEMQSFQNVFQVRMYSFCFFNVSICLALWV